MALVASSSLTAAVAVPLALQASNASDASEALLDLAEEGIDPAVSGPDTLPTRVRPQVPEATIPELSTLETVAGVAITSDTAAVSPPTSEVDPVVSGVEPPPEISLEPAGTLGVSTAAPTSAPATPTTSAPTTSSPSTVTTLPTTATTLAPTTEPTTTTSATTTTTEAAPVTEAPTTSAPTTTATTEAPVTTGVGTSAPTTEDVTTTVVDGTDTTPPGGETTTTTEDPTVSGVPTEILWSDREEGFGTDPLDGAVLTETVYLHFGRSPDIFRVVTWIDDAPAAIDAARPFVITLVVNAEDAGPHTLRVEIHLGDGEVVELTADFEVEAPEEAE